MNLVEAERLEWIGGFAGQTLPRFGGAATAGSSDRRVRPTDLELPGVERDCPRLRAEAQVVENLGSETNVICAVDAPRVDTEATRAAIEAKAADDDQLLAEDDSRHPVTAST